MNNGLTFHSGYFVIDEIFLRQEGVTDFDQYAIVEGNRNFETDLFVDDSVLREVNDMRLAAGWHV
jgi:citronellol/citronellal dehydrogenase